MMVMASSMIQITPRTEIWEKSWNELYKEVALSSLGCYNNSQNLTKTADTRDVSPRGVEKNGEACGTKQEAKWNNQCFENRCWETEEI